MAGGFIEGFKGAFTPSDDDKAKTIEGKLIRSGEAQDLGAQKAKEELLKRAMAKTRSKPH